MQFLGSGHKLNSDGALAHLLQGIRILPDQGSNPCLLYWEADSSPPSHQGILQSLFLIPKPLFLLPVSSHWVLTAQVENTDKNPRARLRKSISWAFPGSKNSSHLLCWSHGGLVASVWWEYTECWSVAHIREDSHPESSPGIAGSVRTSSTCACVLLQGAAWWDGEGVKKPRNFSLQRGVLRESPLKKSSTELETMASCIRTYYQETCQMLILFIRT